MVNFEGVLRTSIEEAFLDWVNFTHPDIDTVKQKILAWLLYVWRGEQRVKFGLTSAIFQELCYTGKALEAQRWTSAQDTLFGLHGEAVARGITDLAMAQLVLDQWNAWQTASDRVEAIYFTAKRKVEAATTEEEVSAALTGLD